MMPAMSCMKTRTQQYVFNLSAVLIDSLDYVIEDNTLMSDLFHVDFE